ncbi:unnamed protein product [Mytilus coruscus]|uniref:Novel STAND NTPase 3 domain-containing protein n=1 Tax=Mytilus coruscus TaxID=42192 RepID=A0A6J8A2D2_MYTCO|nr:unnamed protein product [Mytilus coruscus]
MYFDSLCLIMSLWKISEAVFTFQCPVQSHWKYRAEAHCGPVDSYFCLFDRYRNDQNFTEFCRGNSDFEAPGQKLIVAGSFTGTLQGAPCENYFYQPFKFLSSGNSRCVYKKSYCNEEGQVIYGNGTQKTDSKCRCDYTRGYNFIIRPKHGCYCVPTAEDCYCYSKICPSNYILSPDYECLNENEWKTSFDCEPIETVMLPGSSQIPSTVKPLFGPYTTVNFEIAMYRKRAIVGVLSLMLIIIMINIGFLTSECFLSCLLRSIHRFTGKDQIPFGDRGELDKIATYIANENNGIERTIVAIEDEKQELKDKIRKLENDIVKVPSHVQEFQNETLQDWTRKLKRIVKTRATEFIYETVRAQKVIVIAGPTGAGKSAIAYYTAFRLKEENGYTIIPARQAVDITNYHVPGTKQIFIVDDFIGKYTVDETDVGIWEKNGPLLKIIFSNNADTKLILTSRTHIWQPERYKCLGFSAYTCDLLSNKLSLLLTERWGICHSYLNQVDIKALDDDKILMYSFFPSLCSSYTSSENIPVDSFFTVPYEIIEDEINNFKIKSQTSFIALAILAIKKTIPKNSFSIDNHEYDELFQDAFHESAFLQYPSKNLLKSSLLALTGTYVNEAIDDFMFIHKTLQKIVLRCIANTLIKSVIKYCETEVILNQLRLKCFYVNHDVFTIEVTSENEDIFFRRLVYEVGKGLNKAIFENEQNKLPQFRLKFLKYLKKYLSRDYWTKIQDDNPALHVVSALGLKDYTSFFIHDKKMINQKDSYGNIPLHLACMNGQTKIVEYLVEKKSFIDIANNLGLKPFACACENNAIAVSKFLLHHCAKWINVNEKYQKRNNGSVLHIACTNGFSDIVVLLLNNKADVNARDRSGCTPLHSASNSAVVKALLEFNPNINAVDSLGRCPVYFACSTKNERVLKLLIEKNAEINQKTIAGLRPIHAACQSGNISIVKMLLEKGAKINSSRPGVVPLHEACRVGNESIINILIESNASVNHKTKDGFTPLHQACIHGHIDVTEKLLANKANVNEANKHGCTALFFSCSKGFRTIVDVLLQHGANVNICDEDKVSPLMVACKENYIDVVNSLLRSYSNVNHYDKDRCSSLLVACKNGNDDLVNLLLSFGADINSADKDMISPLHTACMNNYNRNLVLKLVENKANVNAEDKIGQTPLCKSVINGYIDIVDILLRHGASVDICDKSGNSPQAIAEIKGYTTIVDLLRQYRLNN